MGGVLVVAAGVPAAFEHQDFLGITLGYCIMRIALVIQWIRAAVANPDRRTTAVRYVIVTGVIQSLWLARLLLPTDARNQWWSVYLAFFVLVVLEGIGPYWAERTGATTWHAHHIAERYGLFTIILLGETIAVLAMGDSEVLTAGDRVGPLITVGISALVLIFALWWLYFLQPSGEGLDAHREGSYFWGYGHYFIYAGLGALGAGLQVMVTTAGGHGAGPPETAAWAVAVPVALYLLSLLVANLQILPGIRVHLWIVVPTGIIVLILPLAVGGIGIVVEFALTAAVVAGAVAATMALGRKTLGAPS
jgi:low temperature requirement protein LtrA